MLYGLIAGIASLGTAGVLATGALCTPEMMNDPAMRERLQTHMSMMGRMEMPAAERTAESPGGALPVAATRVATIKVEGMTCGGCAVGVRTALQHLDGVAKADVSYEEQRAVVTFDPLKVSTDQLVETVRKFRYTAALIEVTDSK